MSKVNAVACDQAGCLSISAIDASGEVAASWYTIKHAGQEQQFCSETCALATLTPTVVPTPDVAQLATEPDAVAPGEDTPAAQVVESPVAEVPTIDSLS